MTSYLCCAFPFSLQVPEDVKNEEERRTAPLILGQWNPAYSEVVLKELPDEETDASGSECPIGCVKNWC